MGTDTCKCITDKRKTKSKAISLYNEQELYLPCKTILKLIADVGIRVSEGNHIADCHLIGNNLAIELE